MRAACSRRFSASRDCEIVDRTRLTPRIPHASLWSAYLVTCPTHHIAMLHSQYTTQPQRGYIATVARGLELLARQPARLHGRRAHRFDASHHVGGCWKCRRVRNAHSMCRRLRAGRGNAPPTYTVSGLSATLEKWLSFKYIDLPPPIEACSGIFMDFNPSYQKR